MPDPIILKALFYKLQLFDSIKNYFVNFQTMKIFQMIVCLIPALENS